MFHRHFLSLDPLCHCGCLMDMCQLVWHWQSLLPWPSCPWSIRYLPMLHGPLILKRLIFGWWHGTDWMVNWKCVITILYSSFFVTFVVFFEYCIVLYLIRTSDWYEQMKKTSSSEAIKGIKLGTRHQAISMNEQLSLLNWIKFFLILILNTSSALLSQSTRDKNEICLRLGKMDRNLTPSRLCHFHCMVCRLLLSG